MSLLKAQHLLPEQQVNGEWLWLNSLDYLLVCYTQRSILTVLYVVCYQSVTRNSNNISGYIYNREFITQYTTIIATHLANSNLESHGWIFSLTGGVIKNILVSIICVTFNLDACKVSFLYYL